MTTSAHEPTRFREAGQVTGLVVPEMWASLAIAVMWLAVLFDAVFGPDIVSTSAGGNATSIPSAVVVAFFAFFATRRSYGTVSIAAPAATELPALEPVSLNGRRNADTRVDGDATVGSREDRVQVELRYRG